MRKEVVLSEKEKYEGKECPNCQEGKMVHELDHDPMGGNKSVLKCTKVNPCGFTIDIVTDE